MIIYNARRYCIYYFIFFLASFFQFSCRKLVSIDAPNNIINGQNVYSIDETAIAAVTNIYASISKDNHNSFPYGGQFTNISLYTGLSSDELVLFNTSDILLYQFYTNSLTASYDVGFWAYEYGLIFSINSAIEGLTGNSSLSPNVQQQLLGEVKFMRAMCYFYLVNLYGEVPLVTSTDPLVNALLPRSDVNSIYKLIVEDLTSAKELLSGNFLSGNLSGVTSERVRPTKWAASALLARVYLYQGNFRGSEEESTQLINNNNGKFKLESLKDVFLKNSYESIWQLQTVDLTNGNTGDGKLYILPSDGPSTTGYPVYLSHHVVANFEEGDLRKVYWTDSVINNGSIYFFPTKYKSGALDQSNTSTEYIMMFRLAEQYLIRAEDRIQQNEIEDGLADLNIIRNRAGLENITTKSKDSLISLINNERKAELFCEWGHRWLDLKRTKLINNIMTDICKEKGGTWNSNWQLYPISISELQADPKLVQNTGY